MHQMLSRRNRVQSAFILALLVASLAGAHQAPSTPADVIAKVKAQVAPDTRLAVFDVSAQANAGALDVSGEVDQAASKDAVMAALRAAGYQPVDHVVVLPAADLGARTTGIVTVSVANMKSKPSEASEMASQLLMGTAVRLLKRERGWYYAQSMDDRYLGWVDTTQVVPMTREEADAFRAPRHLVITAVYTVVREQASDEAPAVSDAVMGDIMRLQGSSDGWHSIRLPDGRPGFVTTAAGAEYAAWKASRRLAPDTIEQTARLLLGVPYMWGGTSTKAVDCSGFTKTVFRANGFELQRDADQQSTQGEAVSTANDLADLRKGDLLFFGPRPGVTRITHVGIYLGGKRFINSSNGMVRINSLDPASPVYSENLLKRLVNVRRIPATQGKHELNHEGHDDHEEMPVMAPRVGEG